MLVKQIGIAALYAKNVAGKLQMKPPSYNIRGIWFYG
nr:MAG TPA: hypothetical protein [Caudoviricetes sp.]